MEVQIGGKSVSIGNILLIVGGILALISFFLGWVNYETSIGIPGLNTSWSSDPFTGSDLMGLEHSSFVAYMPLLVLIFGIIAIVTAILPMFMDVPQKTISIVQLVVGVLIVVFALIFVLMGGGSGLYSGDAAEVVKGMIDTGVLRMPLQIGCYLGLIGGVLALVGGGLAFKDNM